MIGLKKDYYKILGVQENATQEQIQRVYLEKALEYHPQINQENVQQFEILQEAYNVLTEPHRRAHYDLYRKQLFA